MGAPWAVYLIYIIQHSFSFFHTFLKKTLFLHNLKDKKYKNTYFTVEYGGRIQYYKRKNWKINYLAIGEDWGFYATKDNCGYFVETEI